MKVLQILLFQRILLDTRTPRHPPKNEKNIAVECFFKTNLYFIFSRDVRDPMPDSEILQPPVRDLNQLADDQDDGNHGDSDHDNLGGLSYQEIDCLINDDYNIGCRKEGTEIYMPFSFISKYFEVKKPPHTSPQNMLDLHVSRKEFSYKDRWQIKSEAGHVGHSETWV